MDWKTIEKGYLGQLIVEEEFIKQGWNLFKPVLENGKVDLIVERDNQYLKLQIKTVQIENNKKIIPLRKISHNMGEYKIKLYTEKDIDYFIGVDINTRDLYILPISFSSKYKRSVSISNCLIYKNNFNQMEPSSRNIRSEDDDNGESLTDNADGNSVGIDN